MNQRDGSRSAEIVNEPLIPSSSDKAKDVVELVGKIALGFTAVCYALGLLVVNTHLNKYGAYSLSIFRLNYITAGFWNLLFVLIPLPLALFLTFLFIVHEPHTKKVVKGLSLFRLGLIALGIPVFSILYFIIYLRIAFNSAWFQSTLTGIILSLYFSFIIILSKKQKSQSDRSRFIAAFASLVAMFFLIYHTARFSDGVYGSIPSYVGGGSPKKVQLVVDVNEDILRALKGGGISFVEDEPSSEDKEQDEQNKELKEHNKLTKTVDLVFVTEEEYIIMSSRSAISIPRDTIKAAIFNETSEVGHYPLRLFILTTGAFIIAFLLLFFPNLKKVYREWRK